MAKVKKLSPLFRWQKRAQNPEPGDKCAKCGERRHLTVDHIVPVSWIQSFVPLPAPNLPQWETDDPAMSWEENFQLLCRYCNQTKRNFIDPRDPRTYEVLEKVIAKGKADHLNRANG